LPKLIPNAVIFFTQAREEVVTDVIKVRLSNVTNVLLP
jgi:hypothetical protein